MHQRLRMPDTKPEDISSIPGTHMTEKLTPSYSNFHMCTMVFVPTYMHIYMNTQNKLIKM